MMMVQNELIISKSKQSYIMIQYGNAVWITGHAHTSKGHIYIEYFATILN